MLYRDVTLFVADQLHLDAARVSPCRRRHSPRPQRAPAHPRSNSARPGHHGLLGSAADVLAMWHTTVWTSVLGLLDESSDSAGGAATAVLQRRIDTGQPRSHFDFISTRGQIGDVRLFLRALPDRLSP